MEQATQLETIEISMAHAKGQMAMRDALVNLQKSPDFQLLILDGYFTDEAGRVVMLKSDPSMQGTEQQESLDKAIIAIGGLDQYLRKVYAMGNMAERTLRADAETLEEILQEDI